MGASLEEKQGAFGSLYISVVTKKLRGGGGGLSKSGLKRDIQKESRIPRNCWGAFGLFQKGGRAKGLGHQSETASARRRLAVKGGTIRKKLIEPLGGKRKTTSRTKKSSKPMTGWGRRRG